MRGMRAAATAALFLASLGEARLRARPTTILPRLSDIAAVRRFGVRAQRAALVASLWAEETAGQCVFALKYDAPADFGRIAKLSPQRTGQRRLAAGARALWERMQSAGFEFADDPAALDRLAASPRATPAVRALGSPPPQRRSQDARRAA